jgi:hypothetical protein
MPKSKDRDFFVNARRVVEIAIGEQMNGTPLQDPNSGKDKKAIARGTIGGLRGGNARAMKLTPEVRRAIAIKAAKKRWLKPEADKD